MRVLDEQAFVLHRYAYGESSVLLEVFTAAFGRVGLVARGARRAGRRFAGAYLCPFQPLLLSWSARGDLGTLSRAEASAAPIDLPGAAVWCAFYVNELVLRLVHRHEAHDAIYRAYEKVLQSLAAGGCQEQALRIFEKRLLAGLGYGLGLTTEARSGAAIRAEQQYVYVPDEGPVAAGAAGCPGVAIGGDTLAALAQESITDPRQLREAKGLLRALLANLLGDRPLHTRRLVRSLRGAL